MFGFLEKILSVKGGRSVSAFARDIGMNQRVVDMYLKGERKPSLEFVLNICSTQDVSANWLLGLPERGGGGATVHGDGNAVAVGTGARATTKVPTDCSKCKLMQAHLREITGR